MKKTLTAGLVLAGILALSGTSFAEAKDSVIIWGKYGIASKPQRPPEPLERFDRKPPRMSRDIRVDRDRPPLPPDERHSRMSEDRRHRIPPRSRDRRPPEFDGNRRHQPR